MLDGICPESSEIDKKEESLSSMLDLKECLVALSSSSSACKVGKLVFFLCREGLYPRMIAEHVFSVADCHRITHLACNL